MSFFPLPDDVVQEMNEDNEFSLREGEHIDEVNFEQLRAIEDSKIKVGRGKKRTYLDEQDAFQHRSVTKLGNRDAAGLGILHRARANKQKRIPTKVGKKLAAEEKERRLPKYLQKLAGAEVAAREIAVMGVKEYIFQLYSMYNRLLSKCTRKERNFLNISIFPLVTQAGVISSRITRKNIDEAFAGLDE